MNIFNIALIGFLSGVLGTGFGGLLMIYSGHFSKKLMGSLLGFTSGIMLSVITFDLLPEAFHLSSPFFVYFGIVIGIILMMIADKLMSGLKFAKNASTNSKFIKSGTLMAIGIAMHNFPEGLAVGGAFSSTPALGISLAIIIALHDVPEGIAMALPLRLGGMTPVSVVAVTMLAGVPNGIGAFIGAMLGNISPILISLCLSLAAGSMLYITCGELLPQTYDLHKGRVSTLAMILGLICGLYIAQAL